jgi:photosystem II stability/assembly factor-like uncharacterized protein
MLEKTRWLDGESARHAGRRLPILALLMLLIGLGALNMVSRDEAPSHRHSRTPGDGLAPRMPNPWFFAERSYPVGKIDREALASSRHQAALMREAGSRSGNWTARGPLNVGGRLTAMAVDPRDDDRVYAAAAEGGILRSEDAGQHWTPLFDQGPSLSMGAVTLDPSDPDIVYAGSGEVNPGGGSVAYGGAGLFRSLDRGETWSSLGLEETGAIGRVCVDPSDPDRLFVAAMGQLWEEDPHRGVYRSTDGGDSWQQVLFVANDTGCVDLIQRPDQPDVLFAAMWQRMRHTDAYDYGGSRCAIYRSDDGGDNWAMVSGTAGLPGSSSQGGRIGLSLCAAQPDVICAVYADRTGYFDGLYRSVNGGASWSQTNDGALSGVFASYGWWFGNVRVHPVDPLRIFVLGYTFYRSTNGGSSWSSADGGMHVDHHGLAFGAGASPVIYEGNDGGAYRSSNGGTAWSKLPNLPVTQVYRLALDAGNPDALYLGAQDNGTNKSLGALDDFDNIYGGDGFGPLVHPTSSQKVWAQYQYGGLGYSSNGGGSFGSATSGIGNDRIAWNAPLVQDPTNVDRRYFGTHKLYRSTGNTSWTAVSGDLTGNSGGDGGQVRGVLTAIGVSPLDGQVLWTGSDDGVVSMSENGGGAWSDMSAGLPQRWITSVKGDPFDRETAYVSVSGFRWAESAAQLFKTVDLGASWQPIGAGLPDAPVNDVIPDPVTPGTLWVASDLGVFVSVNDGGSWSMLGSDLPNVVVNHLAFDNAHRRLYAGSYGRSVFTFEVDELTAAPQAEASVFGRALAPYPNPTADGSWIAWELERASEVDVAIYSVAGRKLWSKRQAADVGHGRLRWEGRDAAGRELPSGVYLARVSVAGRELGSRTVTLRR